LQLECKKLSKKLEEKGFEALKSMIYKKLGLDCTYYRDSYLRRRVNFRMRTKEIETYWEYMEYLKDHPEEYSLLIKDLTINYTKFFRDPEVFLYFRTRILPVLLATKKTVRIWSAGCASGEEPYTIAMIINDVLGQRINKYLISIYATDIDEKSLRKAKEGEYDDSEISGISNLLLRKYFIHENNKYRVKNCIRRLVHFRYGDLTRDLGYKNMDVIFCRNVFIYFSKEAQARICLRFHSALNREGYLIIGKTEILPDEVRDKFACINSERKIFRKI